LWRVPKIWITKTLGMFERVWVFLD
jgi:hypothetical protein